MKMIYRCLCAVLGAILGSGCSDPTEPVPEYAPPIPEYGVPNGTVRIDGRVTDHLGIPIPGVQVSFDNTWADTTDAEGRWAIDREHTYIPCVTNPLADCLLDAEDIDGPDGGGFYPPTQVTLDLTQTEPGSGSFDQGTWEQHDIDVVMTDAVEYGPPVAKEKGPGQPPGAKR